MIPAATRNLLADAVERRGLCGAALGVVKADGRRDTLILGGAAREPGLVPLEPDFWWDLASLTKPLFTAREVLRAVGDSLLDLDDPLGTHLPDLAGGTELRSRTLRQLLTHTSGLPAVAPLYTWGDAATIRARMLREPWPLTPPGEVVYSDLGYILLGLVLERVRGRPLRAFALDPGLTFSPDPARTVATERCPWRGRVRRGETHDENAWALGGVAGHAGLFGTLEGVLGAAEALLRGGWLPPAVQDAALRPQVPGRGLAFVTAQPGWSGGRLTGADAYGHTGFTGTGLWVDPGRGLAWVLLTNRVHPTRDGALDIQALRRGVGEGWS